MAAIDFSQFHELAEQFRGEIPIKQLCEQEGVRYRDYRLWRNSMGIAPRIRRRRPEEPEGMLEVEAVGEPQPDGPSPKATEVRIVFENGLTLDRREMDVDSLVEFLTKIRAALCLG